MTTETITELDERTKEELQPPCEANRQPRAGVFVPCGKPAEWIIRVTCGSGHLRTVFDCDEHLSRLVAHRLNCRLCRPASVRLSLLSVEPLR